MKRADAETRRVRNAAMVAELEAGAPPHAVAKRHDCSRWSVYRAAEFVGLDLAALRRASAEDRTEGRRRRPAWPWGAQASGEVCDTAGLARTPERLARAEQLLAECSVWAASDRLAAEEARA